ncbi:hypothetical protein [Flaviflagellibacter deserti]|uniref:Uncharacterized protein n=1 Tax=Flaviflagellibacter deserti TaxID=2267266 RepID=A0ABV9Z018_9HYPH
MLTLAKNSIVRAAAVAALWVVASGAAHAGEADMGKAQARHPAMAIDQAFAPFQMVKPVEAELRHTIGAPKGDLLVSTACQGQSWPYISAECLTGDAPARKVARTITIERRTAESSTLNRVPAALQMAQR